MFSLLAFGLDSLTTMPGIAGMVFLALLSTAFAYASRYKRCPSNKVLVIFGQMTGDRSANCIHGGGRFVWPVIQDYAFLSLEPIQIEVPLRDALSSENIRVNVPSVFTVAVGTEPHFMQNAAIRLLGLNTQQVKKQAEDIIFGQLRQVIASMRIEDINRDREQFLHNIQQSLEPELRKIGLVLINVNITDITDESGYIAAIGRKAASEAVQKARGDVAEQEKIGEVRVAAAERDKLVIVASATKEQQIGITEAERDQAVRIAEVNKEREIGIREAERDQVVKLADLTKERQVGEQRARLEQEALVSQAEQQKRIAVANADAEAIKGETEAHARVADAKATLQVRQAEAYQLAETRKREAEAAVKEAQNRAMAKAALADAERVEAERRAELEAPAKAEKARLIVDAEAAAEKRKLEAQAEAQAIYAKLEAEARGQYEMLAKKGDGLKKIIEACGGADAAFRLLMLEHLDGLAKSSAEAISNIKFDKVVVWENGGNANGQTATSNFLQSMSRTLPPMMQVMRDIGGIEMPEYLSRFASEPNTAPSPNAAGPNAGEPGKTAGKSPL